MQPLFDFYQDQAGEAEDQSYKCQLVTGPMAKQVDLLLSVSAKI